MRLKFIMLSALFSVLGVANIWADTDWNWVNDVPADGAGLSPDTEYYIYAEVDGLQKRFLNAQNGFDDQPTVTWKISGNFPGNTDGSSSYTLTSSAGTNFAMYDKDWACQVRTDATNKSGDDIKIASSYNSNTGTFTILRYKKCSSAISKRNVQVTANGLTSTAQDNPTSCWKFISKAQVKAYQEYVAMQTNIDMTFAIKNPSFETGNLDGWTNDGFVIHANDGKFVGNYIAEMWSAELVSGSIKQTLKSLPAGKYTLEAKVAAGFDGTQYIYAGNNKTYIEGKNGDPAQDVSVDFEISATEDVEIGFVRDNCRWWTGVDDWKLTLVAPKVSATMIVDAELKYATFCAPFEVTVPSGVTASTATLNANGYTIDMTSVGSTIPANTPVILYAESGLEPTTLYGAAVEDEHKAGVLTGVYEEISAPVGSYVLQKQNGKVAFYIVAEGKQPKLPANRCYLTAPTSNARLDLVIEGETGINDLGTENGSIADGKYLQDNKVVIVKNGRKYNVTGQIVK